MYVLIYSYGPLLERNYFNIFLVSSFNDTNNNNHNFINIRICLHH